MNSAPPGITVNGPAHVHINPDGSMTVTPQTTTDHAPPMPVPPAYRLEHRTTPPKAAAAPPAPPPTPSTHPPISRDARSAAISPHSASPPTGAQSPSTPTTKPSPSAWRPATVSMHCSSPRPASATAYCTTAPTSRPWTPAESPAPVTR